MKKSFFWTTTKEIGIVVLSAVLSAFTLHVFVFTNNFAPSGIDGIATMLQKTTGFSAGWFSLIINIPLLVIAFFFINKKYVIYTIIFTALSSAGLVVLETLHFYQYTAENERLLAAIFAGLLLGVRTGLMIRIGASSGGVDIIACIVQKKKPYFHIERIISIICYIIIGLSFFVYENNLNSVIE